MRLLEFLLLSLLTITVISILIPANKRGRFLNLVPVVSITVILLHLLIEDYRWEMVPAYSLAMLLLLFTYSNVLHAIFGTKNILSDRKYLRISGGIISVILLIVCWTIPVLIPLYTLPKPSGPYNIGTRYFYLIDKDRPETFTPEKDDYRVVCARIWYPAEKLEDVEPIGYMENAATISRILTRHTPAPSFLFNSRALIKSHSYYNASILKGNQSFPIILFSHGYLAPIFSNTVLMEELASHGYVAVSIGHAYETPYFIKGNGAVIAFNPKNREVQLRNEERKKTTSILQRILQVETRLQFEKLLKIYSSLRTKALQSLHIWVADISFIIDELEKMNHDKGMFSRRLDTTRVGVIGHSFGGTAAGQACISDNRCKAGVNMDGLQLGDVLTRNLTCPFMFMHHDNKNAKNKLLNKIFFERVENGAYMLLIKDSLHLNFTDSSLNGWGSLHHLLGIIGKIDGKHCLKIQNDYILAFFDKHLKGQKSKILLDGPSKYLQVEFLIRNAAGKND